MPCKFIHIEGAHLEFILDLESIKLVMRQGDDLVIYFLGDENPLKLNGDGATAFWEFVINYAPTIYSVTPGGEKAEAPDS